jgi:hypothetical protein
MHVIRTKFERLDEMPVTRLLGAIGVYVLWSPRADVRPSYPGEGRLIDRFAREHIERFGVGMNGYVSIMEEGTKRRRKARTTTLPASVKGFGRFGRTGTTSSRST